MVDHEVGIRISGRECTDAAEYCISEGWVRVTAGKTVDRKGNPMLIKIKGAVEGFYRQPPGRYGSTLNESMIRFKSRS